LCVAAVIHSFGRDAVQFPSTSSVIFPHIEAEQPVATESSGGSKKTTTAKKAAKSKTAVRAQPAQQRQQQAVIGSQTADQRFGV
jgi:hypothetical protein